MESFINLCITTGVFPDFLKIAKVIPILKKGNTDKPTNYWPIFLLSLFSKIFEKLIYNRIYLYFEKFDLLSDRQFGFRQNSSTVHAIGIIHDKLIQNLYNNLYNCCIFLDLSKAFDTVDHNILISKLDYYFGILGTALDLMKSYLPKRYQYVKINDSISSYQNVTCGIPQGSSLGPLIFLVYVNDLTKCSEFTTTLFADDTYLTLSDESLTNLENRAKLARAHQHKIDDYELDRRKTVCALFLKVPAFFGSDRNWTIVQSLIVSFVFLIVIDLFRKELSLPNN